MGGLAKARITVTATISVGTAVITFPVESVSVSYAINSIPKCELTLPVGVQIPGLTLGLAQELTGSLFEMPIDVYVTVDLPDQVNTTKAIIPVGTTLLFRGFVNNVTYSKSQDNISVSLSADHWLSALTHSSAISASSHPSNPADMTFDGALGLCNPTSTGVFGNHSTVQTLMLSLTTPAAAISDLAGNVILPWLKSLASCDRISFPGVRNDSLQRYAMAALNAFSGLPMPLDTSYFGAQALYVASSILADIGASGEDTDTVSYETLAQLTLWDLLVKKLAASYMFAVIPFPDRAYIAPYIPGLRYVWNPTGLSYTIMARDIFSVSYNNKLKVPIMGVGIFVEPKSWTGVDLTENSMLTPYDIGGAFIARNEGLFYTEKAPRFLNDFPLPSIYSAISLFGMRSSACGWPASGVASPFIHPAQMIATRHSIANRVAQARYMNRMAEGREITITGPLRFDIGPGSSISVQNLVGGSNVVSNITMPQYGTVKSVEHYISGDPPMARTKFTLISIRNATQNTLDAFSIDRHPIYSTYYIGATFLGVM